MKGEESGMLNQEIGGEGHAMHSSAKISKNPNRHSVYRRSEQPAHNWPRKPRSKLSHCPCVLTELDDVTALPYTLFPEMAIVDSERPNTQRRIVYRRQRRLSKK